MSEPKTTDYCGDCGESPESGSHVFDHEYKPPARLIPSDGLLHGACSVSNDDTIRKCDQIGEACPAIGVAGVHSDSYGDDGDGACDSCGARPVTVDDLDDPPPVYSEDFDGIEGSELVVNTREGINVDETWRAIRQPVTTLYDARSLLVEGSETEDIAVGSGGFTVTDVCGEAVAQFNNLEDARLFLSIRALVDRLAEETSRANLAESQVRGLEGTLAAIRNYDRENPAPADAEYPDMHAAFEPDNSCNLKDRPIAVYPEMLKAEDKEDASYEDLEDNKPAWVGSREARCLAASLLRAADEHDAYVTYQRKHNVGPGTEFPNMVAEPITLTAKDGSVHEGVSIARRDVTP